MLNFLLGGRKRYHREMESIREMLGSTGRPRDGLGDHRPIGSDYRIVCNRPGGMLSAEILARGVWHPLEVYDTYFGWYERKVIPTMVDELHLICFRLTGKSSPFPEREIVR